VRGKGSHCCRHACRVYASTVFHVVDAPRAERNSLLLSGLPKVCRRVDACRREKSKNFYYARIWKSFGKLASTRVYASTGIGRNVGAHNVNTPPAAPGLEVRRSAGAGWVGRGWLDLRKSKR
jgi:hypothetical protein